jgi:adenosylcobinamide-GDP ribazoletransferase
VSSGPEEAVDRPSERNEPPTPGADSGYRARREWQAVLLAAQLLTRVPLPNARWSEASQARSVRWLPLVGVLIGVVTGGVLWISGLVFPAAVAAVLGTASGLLLTGCFHEDGLADTCDGLGARDRSHMLEIMRDSRIGTYGTAALLGAFGLKVSALAGLMSVSAVLAVAALVAGHALSRTSVVVVVATSRYVREHGTGKPVAAGVDGVGLAVAVGTGVLALAPLAWLGGGVAAGAAAVGYAAVGCAAGHLVMRMAVERRLGGYTGDTLGATQQASEVGLLLGLLAAV